MHDVILGFRDESRPFQTHNSLTPRTWSIIPARLSAIVWMQYYQEVECFVRDHGIRRVYIHGTVIVPFRTTLSVELRGRDGHSEQTRFTVERPFRLLKAEKNESKQYI